MGLIKDNKLVGVKKKNLNFFFAIPCDVTIVILLVLYFLNTKS